MRHKNQQFFTILILFLVFSSVLSLALGSVNIPFFYVSKWLVGFGENEVWNAILSQFRLPKALTAILAGSALSVSGLQMQTMFRNPLAGPYILGISSGAGLGVALVILAGLYLGSLLGISLLNNGWILVIAAALGSFLSLLIVILAASRIRNSTSLLLVGLMFGAGVSALISLMQYFSQANNIKAYVIWQFGSLGSLSWQELSVLTPIILFSLAMAFILSKNLNLLLLGDDYAKSLGVKLRTTRILLIINTSLLAGSITAFCGPLGFVGLAIPHIARMIFNTSNHRLLTPACILIGAVIMLLFDIIAQLPYSEKTLPINAITSLLGAPFVIWLLLKKSKTTLYGS